MFANLSTTSGSLSIGLVLATDPEEITPPPVSPDALKTGAVTLAKPDDPAVCTTPRACKRAIKAAACSPLTFKLLAKMSAETALRDFAAATAQAYCPAEKLTFGVTMASFGKGAAMAAMPASPVRRKLRRFMT